MIALHCELLSVRLGLLEMEENCPPDMVEAIATVIYAAKRVEVKEFVDVCNLLLIECLRQIANQFAAKFGKEFAAMHHSNSKGTVNQKVLDKLSVQPPGENPVIDLLKDIASTYDVLFLFICLIILKD